MAAPLEPRRRAGERRSRERGHASRLYRTGRARASQRTRGCRVRSPARAAPRVCARRRRRLRDEELPLSRMGAAAVGSAPSRPAGQVGRGPRRGLCRRGARPRGRRNRGAGARCDRAFPGPAQQDAGRHGSVSLRRRTERQHAVDGEGHGRRLRHRGDRHGDHRRVYQHRTGGRLPWCGQARGKFPDRAPGRARGAAVRFRRGGPAAQERDPPLPLPGRSRIGARFRPVRREPR